MVYKDKTFCPFKSCEDFTKCDRAFTKIIGISADSCGMPVSLFGKEPECYKGDLEAAKQYRLETIQKG